MPLTTADRLEILELAARYSDATDHCDGDALADTFTEDGVFEGAGPERRGREAHRASAEAMRASGRSIRHFISNAVIDGGDDRATMTLYVEVKDLGAGAATMLIGRYHDDLVREAGAWKFARRVVEVDWRASA